MPEPDSAWPPYAAARALLNGLATSEARRVVISPGARSTPLALAARACADLEVEIIVDERSAGFFALGAARASGTPVILIATSGSAPAHWLPAIIEAREDGVALLAVSADRPPELIGCGANQATRQEAMLASHVLASFALPAGATPGLAGDLGRRAALAAAWPCPGPVHVNAAFADPARVPWTPETWTLDSPPRHRAVLGAPAPPIHPIPRGRGIIVCGRLSPTRDLARSITDLASALEVPILADVLSGLRFGAPDPSRVINGELALRAADPAPADWSIELGGTPVSRRLQEWTATSTSRIVITDRPDWSDPTRTANEIVAGDPQLSLAALGSSMQPGPGLLPELRAAQDRAESFLAEPTLTPPEAAAMRGLFEALPPDVPVFAGNSLIIRDVETYSGCRAEPLALYANRGVSGIDGNISTATGIVAAAKTPGVAIVGDLAAHHDLNALSLLRRHPLTVVVVNNGGGGIFSLLDHGTSRHFDELWLTAADPPLLDLAEAYDLRGLATDDPEEAVAEAVRNVREGRGGLVELRVDRVAGNRCRKAFWAACPFGGQRP